MDKYNTLTLAQLQALFGEKKTELSNFAAAHPDPTGEDLATARGIRDELAAIKEAMAGFTNLSDMLAEFSDAPVEPEPEVEPEDANEPAETGQETPEVPKPNVSEPPVEPAPDVPPPALASTVETLARKSSKPAVPSYRDKRSRVRITAAPDLHGFSAGQEMPTMVDVAEGVISRARGFVKPNGTGELRTFPTASFAIDFPDELMVDERDGEAAFKKALDMAANETSLPGGSLTAAGGWCAPSETVYDLTTDATRDGLLSLPEIGIRRGGIRFAMSPTFADFYASPGFKQTEAQAEAGTTKTCVDVDCPEFDEERLEADGVCIRVPILTNVGYPEYVSMFVENTLIAHEHWMNASNIGKLVTAAGAARTFANETTKGSTVADTMAIADLVAEQTRQTYRLSLNATVEMVMPFYARALFRADISRRNGIDNPDNADAMVAQMFRTRRINPQYVYDWQDLTTSAEIWPTTFNALMYPAGTFVKGVSPIINLSTVYDAASLAENVYTGLFTEQGSLIAQRKFHADLITIPVCGAGRTGAANFTCS